ncbi:hypothetical protein [Candidatus Bodocaedibacter vickermanii]|uniref:Uncharacterized protein n=1 Tax=Candidatus Bodocaedibacter vickermanii TaxID=2741701 RepID=A0A7L9RTN3_9PROT|nr:hypothetical protein CPBP_00758 [Candidatus Paracaedibacteraceae bacterium 'Lake Konstanz']
MGRKKLFANTDLVEMFPHYSYEHIWEQENFKKFYTTFFVSVFDHWLTEDEVCEQVMSAVDVRGQSKRNNPNWEIYQEYENRFAGFYEALYKKGVHVLCEGKHLLKLKFHKEYQRYYLYDIREENEFHDYIVPSLGVMVSGNFDLTHVVHANPQYFQKDEFEDIVKRAGLHILT